MSVTYTSKSTTPTELQAELMQFIQPKILAANNAAQKAKTNIDRQRFIYEAAAYRDIWTFLNHLTFDVNVAPPNKEGI